MMRLILFFFFAATISASAQTPEQKFEQQEKANREQALKQTMELLRNKSLREQGANPDKAKAVDAGLNKMTGGNSQLNEQIYSLAADIFENLYKEANGDPAKMQELLNQYINKPETFAAKWTPDQRAKLKAISEKVPSSAPPRN